MNYNILSYFMLIVLMEIISCNTPTASESPETEKEMTVEQIALTADQLEMAGVEVGTAEKRAFEEGISCTGVIDVPPQNLAIICAPIGGFVKKLYHIPGEYLRKGDPVVLIEHPNIIQMQQDYLVSKGKMSFLKAEYKRKEDLVSRDATARRAFEEAESNYLVEMAHLKGMEAKLNLIGITPQHLDSAGVQTQIFVRSPLSGYVTKVSANTGQYVNPEMELVSVVNKHHIHLELAVFSQDVARVKKGQKITFQIPGNPETYEGDVYLLGHLVDEERKSLSIHGHIKFNNSNHFIPGTYVHAVIQTEADSIYAVPSGAITRQGDNAYVFVQTDSSFQRREAEIGRVFGDWIEIRTIENIAIDSRIAVKGAYYLQGSL